jgi:uncharacterized membrane protein YwzB
LDKLLLNLGFVSLFSLIKNSKMKQNYKIKFFVLGCFVFGFLSFGILAKPLAVKAACNPAATDEGTCDSSGGQWDSGHQSCYCPSGSVRTALGVSGDSCGGQLPNCGAGLNCVNNVCIVPVPQINETPPAATLPTPATPVLNGSGSAPPAYPCPTGLNPGPNGICLPPSEYTTGLAASTSLSGFIVSLIKILLTFAGMIAVVMLVIGGYWYMAAGGNEEMSEKGRKTILNFVMGLVIIILAYTIVSVIASTLTGADRLIQQ